MQSNEDHRAISQLLCQGSHRHGKAQKASCGSSSWEQSSYRLLHSIVIITLTFDSGSDYLNTIPFEIGEIELIQAVCTCTCPLMCLDPAPTACCVSGSLWCNFFPLWELQKKSWGTLSVKCSLFCHLHSMAPHFLAMVVTQARTWNKVLDFN